MKATDLLREQHRQVDRLFRKLERRLGPRQFEEVVKDLATVLGAHMTVEQEMFYPACAEAMDDRTLVASFYEEHGQIAGQIRRLLSMPGEDPGYKLQIRVIKALYQRHVELEDRKLFAKAEPILGAKQLELLGGMMEARYEEAFELGHEVTIAEANYDLRDVDRILAQYIPTGKRLVPRRPGVRHTYRLVAAPDRKAAAKTLVVKPVPKGKGHRRKPKSGGAGVRKTREGPRAKQVNR